MAFSEDFLLLLPFLKVKGTSEALESTLGLSGCCREILGAVMEKHMACVHPAL